MARLVPNPDQVNHTTRRSGKEYNLRLLQRAQTIFSTLLSLLPSNYTSTIQGPNYTNELKAVAVEIARLELELEAVSYDGSFPETRSDFLYSIVGYLALLNGKIPSLEFSDEAFKKFLLAVIRIYFKGAIPEAIQDAVTLFMSSDTVVSENFLLVRQHASGLDISDQFGFQIDIPCPSGTFPPNVFENDEAFRQLLDVIRPAHTLFTIRYVFDDEYHPDEVAKVLDAMKWQMNDYHYDDFRKYWEGIASVDRLGKKTNQKVEGEDHSDDF